MSDTVAVTGATGFIAQHCILQLLEAGYQVRGTARSSGRTQEVADILAPHLSDVARQRLSQDFNVVAADLMSDEGWDDAVRGCRFVLHVASPFPPENPKHEDELIIPARDGALRVLRAAHGAGVERVVMTSSVAAVFYGRARDHVFNEQDWSDVTSTHIGAYEKSKTLAERAAWDYMDSLAERATMDLVVINPGLVLGPLLTKEWSFSAEAVKKIMQRDVPAIPNFRIAPVDVRDVASAHVRSMTTPDASGQRFICAISSHAFRDIALILSAHLQGQGFKIPTGKLPSFLLPIFAIWDKQVRVILSEVDQGLEIDNTKITTQLGMQFRDLKEMTETMADSMIRFGVVSPKKN
jgi:nucleoside-diphosphate-sugar epimerase